MDEREEWEEREERARYVRLYQSHRVGTPEEYARKAVQIEIELGRCVWSPLISLVHRHRFVPYIDERWKQAESMAAAATAEGWRLVPVEGNEKDGYFYTVDGPVTRLPPIE